MIVFLAWLAGTILSLCALTGYFSYLDATNKGQNLSGGDIIWSYLLCFVWYLSVPAFTTYKVVQCIVTSKKR